MIIPRSKYVEIIKLLDKYERRITELQLEIRFLVESIDMFHDIEDELKMKNTTTEDENVILRQSKNELLKSLSINMREKSDLQIQLEQKDLDITSMKKCMKISDKCVSERRIIEAIKDYYDSKECY